MLGIGPSLTKLATRRLGGLTAPTFTPASLFALGEDGAWFRPNSLTTLYQANPTILPVATAGDPVGQMFDNSKALALGSELITNGDFSAGSSGWTLGTGWSVPTDYALANTSSNGQLLSQSRAGANNKTYRFSADISMLSTPNGLCRIQGNLGGTGQNVFIASNGGLTNGLNFQLLGYGVPTSVGGFNFQLQTNLNYVVEYQADNISVRELLGNHAWQNTAGARPTLRQDGVTGVYYTEDDGGDSINWIAPAGTYTVAYVIPDGTVTILTGQSLSGATDAQIPTQLVEYVAVNRALTGPETTALTNYLIGVANP